jgi:putative protein kinase ArgK-like GTPase of G3E family
MKKRKRRIENYVRQIIKENILKEFWQPSQEERLGHHIDQIMNKERSPYAISSELIEEFKKC